MPKKQTEVVEEKFILPKYLRLVKGAMFLDEESGVKIYSIKKQFVDRDLKDSQKLAKDEFNNKNLTDYGKTNVELDWFFDTTKIDSSKLSRIISAYNYGILGEANPEEPPKDIEELKIANDFGFKENGDRIFIGKNKEVYSKLQNNNFETLRKFVNDSPLTSSARNNLMDMLDYENKGYNPLNRARFEVLELIRKKLQDFGPGISDIRVND